MMYYRISKNEKILFFWKKNRPGVGSDLKHKKYGIKAKIQQNIKKMKKTLVQYVV